MLFALAISAQAADHVEAPGAIADSAADINDFYAWVEGGNAYLIMTVQPLFTGPATDAYDRDVLYQFHADDDGDNIADLGVDVRFGPDGAGGWGVQVDVGSGTPIEGPVDTVLTDGPFAAYAGISDDPFFFDLTGFQDTLSSGTLSFTGADAFAGANVLTIAVQLPAPSSPVSVWATTSRINAAPL